MHTGFQDFLGILTLGKGINRSLHLCVNIRLCLQIITVWNLKTKVREEGEKHKAKKSCSKVP